MDDMSKLRHLRTSRHSWVTNGITNCFLTLRSMLSVALRVRMYQPCEGFATYNRWRGASPVKNTTPPAAVERVRNALYGRNWHRCRGSVIVTTISLAKWLTVELADLYRLVRRALDRDRGK